MKKKSERVEYKLKDGSVWSAIYNSYNVSRICRQDVEKLMEAQDKAYEQAQQLQTIIENLEEIKAKERCRAIDDFAEKMRSLNTLNCFMDYISDEIDLEELMHYASEEIAEQLKEESNESNSNDDI